MSRPLIAALFVETGGCYFCLDGVDAWDRARDAREYPGPHAVVAHPPCERWGRYWHGSPRKPHQYELGADDGCFERALAAVDTWGGVLEHPAYSHAWKAFGLPKPDSAGGWRRCGVHGWTCHVEQAHYGHMARKATWLFATCRQRPDDLIWGPAPQRLPQIALERHGYAKARRTGVMAYIGGKDKQRIRAATPPAFRDALIAIARGGAVMDAAQLTGETAIAAFLINLGPKAEYRSSQPAGHA